MSRVHPPDVPVVFAQPLEWAGSNSLPGWGHVVSVGWMLSSIRKGWLTKWLVNPEIGSVHSTDKGGAGRFTSFWSRQEELPPGRLIWGGWVGVGPGRALTPFPPPERF